MMKVSYGVLIDQIDGEFVVTLPDFPEARTQASNFNDAFDAAVVCLEATLAARIRKGEDIPAPSLILNCKVTPGAEIASKALLHKILRQTGKTAADLAKKLGKDEDAVRRLLDPDQAADPAELSAAIAALGVQLAMAACSIRVGS